jgi:hypothetical protein
MKASYRLFVGLSVFYAVMAVIYYSVGGEAVGITCIALSSGLAGIVGFYVWFNNNRMGMLPQDDLSAEIADGAGELGFYSPHSWWPLPVALSACAAGLGLLIGMVAHVDCSWGALCLNLWLCSRIREANVFHSLTFP